MNSDSAPISLVVAMDSEIVHFFALAPIEREEQDGIWRDRYTTVNGLPVVVTKCGIGMVAAAAATERVINRHQPQAVLNFGCTGAHRRDIMPGDIVIGDRVVHHSRYHLLASGEEHYTGHTYHVGDEKVEASELEADPAWLRAATSAASTYSPLDWPRDAGWPSDVPMRSPIIYTGTVVSADIWTQQHARLDILHARHDSLCEDMEAAAINQIAAMHSIPYLTIKDISNNEYYRATDIAGEMGNFPFDEAGKRAAELTLATIDKFASQA
jgi:adenosylhomocysteine nucleosidase